MASSFFNSIGSSVSKAFKPVSRGISSGYKTVSNAVKKSGLDRQVLSYGTGLAKDAIEGGASAAFGPEAGIASKYLLDKYGDRAVSYGSKQLGRKMRGRGAYIDDLHYKKSRKRKTLRLERKFKPKRVRVNDRVFQRQDPTLSRFLENGAKRSGANAFKSVNVNTNKSAIASVATSNFIGSDSWSGDVKSPGLVDPVHIDPVQLPLPDEDFMEARDLMMEDDREGVKSLNPRKVRGLYTRSVGKTLEDSIAERITMEKHRDVKDMQDKRHSDYKKKLREDQLSRVRGHRNIATFDSHATPAQRRKMYYDLGKAYAAQEARRQYMANIF